MNAILKREASSSSSPRRGAPALMASDPLMSVTAVQLPEHALCDGLSDLRLATGEHVGLRDYASAVAVVLSALERGSVLKFRA
jgi:hypothetical protein